MNKLLDFLFNIEKKNIFFFNFIINYYLLSYSFIIISKTNFIYFELIFFLFFFKYNNI